MSPRASPSQLPKGGHVPQDSGSVSLGMSLWHLALGHRGFWNEVTDTSQGATRSYSEHYLGPVHISEIIT